MQWECIDALFLGYFPFVTSAQINCTEKGQKPPKIFFRNLRIRKSYFFSYFSFTPSHVILRGSSKDHYPCSDPVICIKDWGESIEDGGGLRVVEEAEVCELSPRHKDSAYIYHMHCFSSENLVIFPWTQERFLNVETVRVWTGRTGKGKVRTWI